MAYRIAGEYVAGCNCAVVCPCPVDGPPTGPDGTCRGMLVFDVRDGKLDDTDLGGTAFALVNYFPSNLTSGNWTVGIYVDEGASDEQAQAIERIISGEEGGPFADFKPLIGTYVGMERASVKVDGKSASISGVGDVRFEPFTGADGSPTTVKGAMYGFAPEFKIGKASGRAQALGEAFELSYGESAEYEFSSEMTDTHVRA